MYTNNDYGIRPREGYGRSSAYGVIGSNYGEFDLKHDDLGNYRPAAAYLQRVDRMLENVRQPYDKETVDIPSTVFANQTAEHALNSYHLAGLIQQRREMAEKHLADIKFRLNDLLDEKSITKMLNLPSEGKKLTNIERQILDLEKQQRDIQTRLWKDTLDLQSNLLQERSEYQATKRRSRFLGGEGYVV